jgi:hypothetical protein
LSVKGLQHTGPQHKANSAASLRYRARTDGVDKRMPSPSEGGEGYYGRRSNNRMQPIDPPG